MTRKRQRALACAANLLRTDKLPGDWLVRMRYNPFYDLLESRTFQWIEAAGR